MVDWILHRVGVRSAHLQTASLGSVALCVALWLRAKTIDQDQRGNAERRALFVGLWPPMLWLIGDTVRLREQDRRRPLGTGPWPASAMIGACKRLLS
jgi:hypothetical protein